MPTTRSLLLIAAACLAVGLLCVGYGYFIEPGRLVVNRYEMDIADWDPAFNGFRVALISDIHAGSNDVTADRLREIVDRTNEQNVDAIFLLGDYVSQSRGRMPDGRRGVKMEPAEIAEGLSGLRAQFGVYVVLGNHDEWYDPQAVGRAFEQKGYTVLNGKLAEIRLSGGQKLRVLGLKDHTTIGEWKVYSDAAKKLLEPTNGQGNVIVLQHSPDVVPAITGGLRITPDPMVLFAGHTHGGQIRLPVIGAPVVPSMFGQKFARGHVRDSGIDVFVTSGIGTSILPFRFLVPPEIAVVTLRRAGD
ncbi:MAG: metallophosphoesterase [Acidobacteria bacterium]|nr:metallophosphoesterase [Acidobacteriota bacterium]